jgi:hypothetical protein
VRPLGITTPASSIFPAGAIVPKDTIDEKRNLDNTVVVTTMDVMKTMK